MKRVFDHTFKKLSAPMSKSSQEELSRFTETLFYAFDRLKLGKVNAVALACGFTVLCGGRKSDKLEHVFELLDEDKDSLVSRQDITKFIQSFLVMLMSVSSSFTQIHGGACCDDSDALSRAIDAGSEWATSQVFDALQPKNGTICFDDFADWYTKGGYQSMPWLELLDLRKWVLSS
jgi:Ca2+-binding EF-hand superfamily protein